MNKLTTLAGSLVLVSGLAFAGDMDQKQKFEQLDTDRDGTVTAAEATADKELMANFQEADANRDGYLTQAEYEDFTAESEDAE